MALRISERQYRALLSGKAEPKQKYGNKKTRLDGIEFDSAFESRHYAVLRMLQKAGQIRRLRRQVTYDIVVNGTLVCHYIADFVYDERMSGFVPEVWKPRVVDCKNPATRRNALYRLKKKLMKSVLGISIIEVMAPGRPKWKRTARSR